VVLAAWQARPLSRFDPEPPSLAVARMPCCDLPAASASQPAAAGQAQSARQEEQRQRLVQAEAQQASAEVAQEQLSRRRAQPARAASSPAEERMPCSGQPAAPVRRRLEPAAVRKQRSVRV
jgi:hypothetical protein